MSLLRRFSKFARDMMRGLAAIALSAEGKIVLIESGCAAVGLWVALPFHGRRPLRRLTPDPEAGVQSVLLLPPS